MQHQPAGVGVVGGNELDIAFHEGADEGDVTAETVELGDQQDRAVPAADIEGERELGAVVFGAALDLGELGQDGRAASGEELLDGGAS
jgi:hypothetical protein